MCSPSTSATTLLPLLLRFISNYLSFRLTAYALALPKNIKLRWTLLAKPTDQQQQQDLIISLTSTSLRLDSHLENAVKYTCPYLVRKNTATVTLLILSAKQSIPSIRKVNATLLILNKPLLNNERKIRAELRPSRGRRWRRRSTKVNYIVSNCNTR